MVMEPRAEDSMKSKQGSKKMLILENIFKPQNPLSNKDRPSLSKPFVKTNTIIGFDKILGQSKPPQSPSGSTGKNSMSGKFQTGSEKKKRSAQEKTFIKMQLGNPNDNAKNSLANRANSIEEKNTRGAKTGRLRRNSVYVKPTNDTGEPPGINSPGSKVQRPKPTSAGNINVDRARRASKTEMLPPMQSDNLNEVMMGGGVNIISRNRRPSSIPISLDPASPERPRNRDGKLSGPFQKDSPIRNSRTILRPSAG
jgi:hypothetical protein